MWFYRIFAIKCYVTYGIFLIANKIFFYIFVESVFIMCNVRRETASPIGFKFKCITLLDVYVLFNFEFSCERGEFV